MHTHVDPRGKYFTDVVRTEAIPVVIKLEDSLIRGKIHLHPEHRLLDQLNEDAGFMAVTDVQVEGQEGTITGPFMAIRRDRIQWVIPQDEMTVTKAHDAR
ncbi:MAG: hypothetical protein WBR18_13780 [Anaerolineales bacterium]